MATKEIKTFAETNAENGDEIKVVKDPKYDMRGRLGYTIHSKRYVEAPYEGVELENETKNQYGKKDGTITFERKRISEHLGFPKSRKEEIENATKAEQYYRKTHGGHSRIGSILRDGYKEPERDKNELQDYEKEALRED